MPSDTKRNALLEPEDDGGEDELDEDMDFDEDALMDGKVSCPLLLLLYARRRYS